MKEGWKMVPFEACLKKVPKQKQIKAKEYASHGLYPIVSQEAEMISGYHDDSTLVYHHDKPIVIFGDHTKNIKYIDFDFIVGADGTHILMPIEEIDSKFFYYCLSSIELRNLGYARHYKLLKEKEIPLPPLPEQQRIVEYLDSTFAEIDALKAKAAEEVANAKAMFDAALREEMTPKEGWEVTKMEEVCSFSQGIQVDLNNQFAEWTPNRVRFLRIIDFTQGGQEPRYIEKTDEKYMISKNDIAMVRYGTIGYVCFGYEGVIANNLFKISIKDNNRLRSDYLQYFLKSDYFQSIIKEANKGVAMPAISFKTIKPIRITFPSSILDQQAIVARLDTLRALVTSLEQKYTKIAAECDALKQAILKETFE